MTALVGLLSGDQLKTAIRWRGNANLVRTVSKKKADLLREDGWTVEKRNKKSIRLTRPKPAQQKHEDDVWTLFAKMGFKEMSDGRSFAIHVLDGGNPRQIDVFAKDDECAILAECTQSERPMKRNMGPLIDKICGIRTPAHRAVQRYYANEGKLKQKWVIATRNIEWGDADLHKAEENNIVIFRDSDLDYFTRLVSLLGVAARYQFLAHVFGGEEIPNLSLDVAATRGSMGKTHFYNFLISPSNLLKISYVSHKASGSPDALDTYQRLLKRKRLKQIAEYVERGGKFPTNIVININTKRRLRFDKKGEIGDAAVGTLTLPSRYAAAWVIDGQHRLYGYAFSDKAVSATVPVVAFENLPAAEQARLFVDINHEQVKVRKALLIDLFAELHWNSEDPDKRILALCSRVTKALEENVASPFYNRIEAEARQRNSFRSISLTSISSALEKNHMFGEPQGEYLKPGPLSAVGMDSSLKKGVSVLSSVFELIANKAPENWKLGSGVGGYLCTNNAVVAVIRVLKDVCDDIDRKGWVKCHEMDAGDLYSKVRPFFRPLAEFFSQAGPKEYTGFRLPVGSKGQKAQAMNMEKIIHEAREDFSPPGLTEHIEAFDQASTGEARDLVTTIQIMLYQGTISRLKKQFGEDWWRRGVPEGVRAACAQRAEQDTEGLPKEKQFMLIDYKTIAATNWELLKDDFSLTDEGSKDARLKWMQELIRIRNRAYHPERGLVTKTDLAFLLGTNDALRTRFQEHATAEEEGALDESEIGTAAVK